MSAPMRAPKGPRPKIENPGKVLKRLLSLMYMDYKARIWIVGFCIIASSVVDLIGMLFLQTLIDDYIVPLTKMADPNFGPLALALMKLAILYLVGILATYGTARLMVDVCQGTMTKLRDKLFVSMEALPIRYFDTHSHGDIMSVYTNDVDTLRQLMGQSLPNLLSSLLAVSMTLVSMLVLSVPLTLISIGMIFFVLFLTKVLASKSMNFFSTQQKNLGVLNGYIEEMISGQKVVKVFCHEEKCREEFLKRNEDLRSSSFKANMIGNIIMPLSNNLGHISYVLCAIVGALIAIKGGGRLTLGMVITFLTLNKNFSRPVSQMGSQISSIIMAIAGADRVFRLMDEQPESDDGDVTLVRVQEAEGALTETTDRTGLWAWKKPDGELVRLRGDVVFDNVDFGYTEEKQILYGINMFAEPGQKLAFVGSTGAGKTTITNLINRFYDIQDGKIRYDGININRIRKSDLRRSLGMVLQDTHLFTGTVMDNIRYGRLDATDEECIEAAKLANADGFIGRLPDGYQTVLTGDGTNLSQGQRQLLAIARAAVADPPVLILDEATSSIDTRTESLVQAGMDALMKGRTTFVIAHRLSTISNADCIMVMEQGRIIERGNHDELIEKKGRYYQLYTGNFAEE